MPKLTLDLDALRVQTFATHAPGAAAPVQAPEMATANTCYRTCYHTCLC
jgi:hypothetical protein